MNGFWVCYGMIACMFAFTLTSTAETESDRFAIAVSSAIWPVLVFKFSEILERAND